MSKETHGHDFSCWADKISLYFPIYMPYDVYWIGKNRWMYIENAARLGDTILEVGCQTALACIAIKTRYPWKIVVASDIHPTVCKMGKERIKYWGMDIPIVRCDGFRLPFRDDSFDVCLHEGLFEHYGELEVIEMEAEHLRVAKHLVLDVPANPEVHKVDERGIIAEGYGYGDEHIRTFQRWMEILSAKGKVIHIFHRSPGHFGAVVTRALKVAVKETMRLSTGFWNIKLTQTSPFGVGLKKNLSQTTRKEVRK